ncbi:MAG: hypothetical protein Kilf2KO_02800 [Rhodospirillales bacterium]
MAAASRAIGRNHAYLQQYLRRGSPRVLDASAQLALATLFKVAPDSFAAEGGETVRPGREAVEEAPRNAAIVSERKRAARSRSRALPPTNALLGKESPPQTIVAAAMPRDLPVLGSTVGGSSGDFSLNGDVVDYVRRPPTMAAMTQAFALFVQGDSMWPWRAAGSLVYLHPARPPRLGDHVVVELHASADDPEGDRPCFVKRLVGRSASTLRLAQYNPPREDIEVPTAGVRNLYRVMEWEELLGI